MKRSTWLALAGGASLAVAAGLFALQRGRSAKSSLSASPDTESEIEPTIAVTKDRAVAVAWMGVHAGAPDRIGVRFSSDAGATWGDVLDVRSPDRRFAADPVLVAADAGSFYLTWLGFHANIAAGGEPYDVHVYVAKVPAGGSRFAAPMEITDPIEKLGYDKPWSAVASDGSLLVAYRYESAGRSGIAIARSADGGASFTRAVLVEGQGFEGALPSICAAAHGGRAWITYVDPGAGVIVRSSEDGGATWPHASVTTLAQKSAALAFESSPCVGDGDDVWVAYGSAARPWDTGASALLRSISIARSRDGGKSFDAPRVIQEQGMLAMHPAIARGPSADASIDVAFFEGTGDGDAVARFRWLRTNPIGDPGRVVREPLTLASRRRDRAWPGDYVGLAAANGFDVTAFVDNASGAPHIEFARLPY